MTTARKAALVAVLVVAACGANKPDGEPLETARSGQRHEVGRHAPGGDPGHAGSGEAEARAALPPPVEAFHEALAPRWHAEQGAQRMADTCAAISELRSRADAIVAAPAPAGRDAAAWELGGKQLAEAAAALEAPCQAHDAVAFEAAFTQVHERFHGVLEAATGERGEHGDSGH
jgi:hypothetical protein